MVVDVRQRFAALKASGTLPSPQGVALAVARLATREDASNHELTRLIKSDPAMSALLLHYANTVQGGSRRPIAALADAVIFLGLHRVRQLALVFSLFSLYRSGSCRGFDYERYWSESLATGVGMQELCGYAQAPADESFTCGLLAGIGRLGFASVYPGEYAPILAVADDMASLRESETAAFGFDHADLAAEMFIDWGLPTIFADAVRFHETPDDGTYTPGSRTERLVQVLHLAARIASLLVAGRPNGDGVQALYHAAARVGLEAPALAPVIERISAGWAEWSRQLRLSATPRPVGELLVEAPAGHDSAALLVVPMRIALITADRALWGRLSESLHDFGLQPVIAERWPAAAAAVRTEMPDILFVDMRGGAGDPLLRLREIRQAEAPHRGHFVALIAREDEACVAQLIRAGVDDYLLLPLQRSAFEARLHAAQRVLALQRVARAEREASIRQSSEWARSNRRLLREALSDPLTQLPNRRYGIDFLTQECAFAYSARMPLACLMLDVDHFKKINDVHGHPAGDDILRQVAACVQANCRKNDLVFRYGGEEFCVVCPSTLVGDAMALAERILAAIRATAFIAAGRPIALTLSVGVATLGTCTSTAKQLIAAADAALYRAKATGRDRLVLGEVGA